MSARRTYATDLSDEERRILKPFVPEAKPRRTSARTLTASSWTPFSA
jgi:transposase